MKTFTCKMCGKEFESSANHADYCVECRAERQRIRTRTYTAKKKNNEATNRRSATTAVSSITKSKIRSHMTIMYQETMMLSRCMSKRVREQS